MADQDVASAYVSARRAQRGVLTNFYPLYDDGNDQVDRVTSVHRTLFQRIFPRYELSTSDTRDAGLGPEFVEQGTGTYGKLDVLAEHPRRTKLSSTGSGVAAVEPGGEAGAGAAAAAVGAEAAQERILHPSRPLPRGWLPAGAGRYVDMYV